MITRTYGSLYEEWQHYRRRPPHQHHRHRHHHPHLSAVAVNDLGISAIIIDTEHEIMSVTITGTTPSTRKSGNTLQKSEIDQIKLFRNDEEIDSTTTFDTTFTFRDLTPLTGNDDYTVKVLTKDGLINEASNVASVNVVGADPASPVEDLSASIDPPVTSNKKK